MTQRQHVEKRDGSRNLKLLLLSAENEDRLVLERLLNPTSSPDQYTKWSVVRHATAAPAIEELKQGRIPVVICEAENSRDCWRRLLDVLTLLPNPPMLIVASRLADERLWVEALNLGAWDVLAKPLDRNEVTRSVHSAWLHWSQRRPSGVTSMARAS